MLITSFNKMIRNRYLWAFFAVVVVIAFVFAFSPGFRTGSEENTRDTAGTLYGENISYGDFFTARLYSLGLRERNDLTPEANEIVRERTWRRIAALKTAENMGISVSDEELAQTIQNERAFAVNGIFNQQQYAEIIRSKLGVSVPMFEDFMRQEIVIRKLVDMLESAVWIPAYELEEKIKNITDSFTIKYAEIQEGDYTADITVTEDDILDFYYEHTELFTIPEKLNVRYVEFPISNYLSDSEIDENTIIEYYSDHIEEYSSTDTNGESVSVPLDYVRDIMIDILKWKNAESKAGDEGTRFVTALDPRYSGKEATFEKIAAALGLAVHTTAFFSAAENVPGLKVGYDFIIAAQSLDADNPERYFSDAITGTNSVYVIAANEKRESYIPDFPEIKDDVMPFVIRKTQHDFFKKKADEIENSVKTSLQNSNAFETAIQSLNMNISTTITFSAYEAWTDQIDYYDALVPSVITKQKGELTELVEVPGGALIVFVEDREPSDLAAREMVKPEFVSALSRYRAGLMLDDWENYMLNKGGFKDLYVVKQNAEDDTGEPQESLPEPEPL